MGALCKELKVTRQLLELKTHTLNEAMDETDGLAMEMETLEQIGALKLLRSTMHKWKSTQVVQPKHMGATV